MPAVFKFCLPLSVAFVIFQSFVCAHQPRIPTDTKTVVVEPEISKAYYSTLRGQAHTYSIASEKPFDLYVNNTDDFTIKDGNSGTVVLAVQKSTLGGNIQFNSGYGSIATAYGCRAWAQFNGVGPSIRGSGNISSITSPATGTYILNFTTAMPDANYSIVGNHSNPSGGVIGLIVDSSNGGGVNPSTSSFQIYCTQGSGGSGVNPTYVNIAVFR